jgi:hypothetical protein
VANSMAQDLSTCCEILEGAVKLAVAEVVQLCTEYAASRWDDSMFTHLDAHADYLTPWRQQRKQTPVPCACGMHMHAALASSCPHASFPVIAMHTPKVPFAPPAPLDTH